MTVLLALLLGLFIGCSFGFLFGIYTVCMLIEDGKSSLYVKRGETE